MNKISVSVLCSVPLRTAIAYFITVKKAEFDKQNRYITQAYLEPEISRIKKEIQGGKYRHLSAADKKKVHSKQVRFQTFCNVSQFTVRTLDTKFVSHC
jgi:hypothetical protein